MKNNKRWLYRLKFNYITQFFLVVFFLVFVFTSSAQAMVVFEDNFDGDPDWHQATKRDSCDNPGCSDQAPGEWDYYNNDEKWNPAEGYPSHHYTSNINSINHRGISGKAFTEYNESHNGNSGDGWGADGILAKDLNNDYDEIYVQMYIKYQPGFQWRVDPGSALKQVYFSHWDRTGSVFRFFSDGNNGPIIQYYPGRNQYHDIKQQYNTRCKPQNTNYYCKDGSGYAFNGPFIGDPDFIDFIGDGNWHKYDWHIKVNSTPGSEDGIIEFWIDDVLEYSKYDIQFADASTVGSYGWNIVAIGGNSNNTFAPESELKEQWYSIDDVCVTTTQADLNNCFSINSNLRADVDNNSQINSTDAMLTLRNSLGLDMSGTNWQSSSTTGDADCDGDTDSTDAMLILRYSLGLDMSGTGWCGN